MDEPYHEVSEFGRCFEHFHVLEALAYDSAELFVITDYTVLFVNFSNNEARDQISGGKPYQGSLFGRSKTSGCKL